MGYDLRLKVTQLLESSSFVASKVEGRIFQRSGMLMESPPNDRPFIVYHFGREQSERVTGSETPTPSRRNVQVWVHDAIGDFYDIDMILDEIRLVFELAEPEGAFLELAYLERSPDLLDDGLHTNTRWSRFQATLTE